MADDLDSMESESRRLIISAFNERIREHLEEKIGDFGRNVGVDFKILPEYKTFINDLYNLGEAAAAHYEAEIKRRLDRTINRHRN